MKAVVSTTVACASWMMAQQPGQGALQPRRIRRVGGHGDDAGVQAAEEAGDVVQPRRVEQQRPLPAGTLALQRGRDGARLRSSSAYVRWASSLSPSSRNV